MGNLVFFTSNLHNEGQGTRIQLGSFDILTESGPISILLKYIFQSAIFQTSMDLSCRALNAK